MFRIATFAITILAATGLTGGHSVQAQSESFALTAIHVAAEAGFTAHSVLA